MTQPGEDAVTADDLKNGDIFINYASIDDKPLTSTDEGWISRFHHNLEVRMEQLAGREVRVLCPSKSRSAPELDEGILRALPEVKTMVSILSPPFIHSTGCVREIETFWQDAATRGQERIGGKSRLFKAVKTPVEPGDLPQHLDTVFSQLLGFDFYEVDAETGRFREFSESRGLHSEQRFHERVYDLAQEINGVLKGFDTGGAEADQSEPGSAGKTVYLATTTSDLDPDRDAIRRELISRGHTVLPDRPLPLVAAKLEQAVREILERCDFAIHLIGSNYGVVPEGAEHSLIDAQNRLAAERAGSHGLPRIIWTPKNLAPEDPRQVALVDAIRTDPGSHAGAELVVGSIENLKTLALEVLHPKPKAIPPGGAKRENEAGARPPRIYLICDPKDEEATEPVEDYLFEQGFEVSLPDFGANESEAAENHRENLRDCDAVIIFYGAARSAWVDIKIRNTVKASGYGRTSELAATTVYLAPPFDRRKERFRTHSADVIRQGDTFDPEPLAPLVQRLKERSLSS